MTTHRLVRKGIGQALGLVLVAVLALVSLVVAGVSMAPVAKAAELEVDIPLGNGDFEITTGAPVPSWSIGVGTDGEVAITDDLAYSGDHSLRFTDLAPSAPTSALSERLTVEEDYAYTITAFVYLTGTNPLPNIYARYFDENGTVISSSVSSALGPRDQWNRVTHSFEPPENAATFSVMLYTGLNSVGVTYFDAVTVTAQRPLTETVVLNPGFEEPLVDGLIPRWTQTFGTPDAVSLDDAIVHSGQYSARIVDTSDTVAQGIESTRFPVVGGENYRAVSHVYRAEGSPLMYLRFYDSSGTLLSSTASNITTPIGAWGVAIHDERSPQDATHASILLYSAGQTISDTYFDDVSIGLSPVSSTNLGPQHYTVNAAYSMIAENSDGEKVGYLGVYGSPASLVEVDLETGQPLRSTPLPGAGGVWGIDVSDDGIVYAGTLSNGSLYRWDPDAGDATLLGKPVATETYINALTVAPDGTVYGGTFPNGHVFSYDPDAHANGSFASAINDYGPVLPGATYTRSIHWHLGKVYAGAGTPAALVELDPQTGVLLEISRPSHIPAGEMVYGIESAGDVLSVRHEFPGNMMTYDPATEEWSHLGASTGLVASPLSQEGEIFFRDETGGLSAYHLASKTLRQTGINEIPNMRPSGWVELTSPQFPGETLVWFDATGNLYQYNPTTEEYNSIPVQVPGVPVSIHSIGVGSNGLAYTSAYVSGGLVSYDPSTSQRVELDTNIGQADSFVTDGNRLWIGAYTKAHLWEFDTTQDGNGQGTATLHYELSAARQDRPMALVKHGDIIVMGTVAEYGLNGGALTVYDLSAADPSPVVHPNIVDDHSVIALATDPGSSGRIVYGGTSVDGGLGSTPTSSQGKVFAFDLDTGQVLWAVDGAPGERAVPGVVVTPSGSLWAIGTGTLVEFDPTDGTVLRAKQLVDSGNADVVWTNSAIDLGPDGNLYVWAGRQIMRVDPVTLDVMPLTTNVIAYAPDFAGEVIYFGRGTDLHSLDISQLLEDVEYSDNSLL